MKTDVIRVSELGASEISAWHQMMDATPTMRRACFSPEFALACEQSYGNAFVSIFHQNGDIIGFFPFQFESKYHHLLGSAVRIGENMSDHAGLICKPDINVSPRELLTTSGLSHLYLTHLMPDQVSYGLTADKWQLGHAIDLKDGPEAFFVSLREKHQDYCVEIEQALSCLSKAGFHSKFRFHRSTSRALMNELIRLKRDEFIRTGAKDVFSTRARLDLLEALRQTDSEYCRLVTAKVSLDTDWLAGHLGLQCKDVLSQWFPVSNENFKKFFPWHLLLWETIRKSKDHNIRYIDQGLGNTGLKSLLANENYDVGETVWHTGSLGAVVSKIILSVRWRLCG